MDKLELAKQKLAELVEHSSKYHDCGQKSTNAYKNTYMLIQYIEDGKNIDELVFDNCRIKHSNGEPIDLEYYSTLENNKK